MKSTPENYGFTTILRTPDMVIGATESSDFRFEENIKEHTCPVEWSYLPDKQGWKVIIHPSKEPVKYLKLRWHGDFSRVEAVLGDEWGRVSATYAPIEWKSVMPFRPLPWFCIARAGEDTVCYGVKTGCDCFAFFQLDCHGITLFMNLMSGAVGTDVRESFVACEVTETACKENESVYDTARRFMGMLCERPVLPKEPVFGVNNWYWAYGNISRESVLRETDYLMELTDGVTHRPCMIIDDGWQLNRTSQPHYYIGGPFKYCNERFGDMQEVAARIAEKGARPGIWYRPLLTLGVLPDEVKLRVHGNGIVMDPSHPYTLERLREDSARIRNWGYEIIKHDFSTNDALGEDTLEAVCHTGSMVSDGKRFFDNTKTTATILKNMYKAIQQGAGDADIIGCSTIGHLSAGIHSIQRVGNDTSGRSIEWTIRNGVHSFMRLPMNGTFFNIDPDCAAFTEKVDAQTNIKFMELCAITGSVTLASVTPYSLTDEQMESINKVYKLADSSIKPFGISHFERCAIPEEFTNGTENKNYNWTEYYDGSRVNITWYK